jgi:hypothetical protein
MYDRWLSWLGTCTTNVLRLYRGMGMSTIYITISLTNTKFWHLNTMGDSSTIGLQTKGPKMPKRVYSVFCEWSIYFQPVLACFSISFNYIQCMTIHNSYDISFKSRTLNWLRNYHSGKINPLSYRTHISIWVVSFLLSHRKRRHLPSYNLPI